MSRSASYQSELTRFFDALSIGLIQRNAEGIIVYCNSAAELITGMRREQIVGKITADPDWVLIHEDGSVFSTEEFPSLITLRTGEPQRNIIMGLRKPGDQLTWLSINSDAVLDREKNTREFVITTFTDITEIKRSKGIVSENETRFRGIFNSAYQFIGLLSNEGRIIEANETALNFARLTANDVQGKFFWESYSSFFPPQVSERLKDDIKKAADGDFVRYSTPLKTPDGILRWIDFSLKPIFDHNKKVVLIIAEGRDVTDAVELQDKFRREQAERQKEVLRATVDAQEKERNEIGKELHDNINQMLASVKLLMETYRENYDAENKMLVKGIVILEECIEEIRRLSGSLVSPKVLKIGFAEAVKSAIDTLLTARAYRVNLSLDEHVIARLTEQQVLASYRIIQEQLNNIIKHAGANVISIALSGNEKGIRLEIADDGKGFDPGEKSKGIGLLNMENRVRLLNGEFNILSEEGKGCTIVAFFPFTYF